jgi:hypothetical protein
MSHLTHPHSHSFGSNCRSDITTPLCVPPNSGAAGAAASPFDQDSLQRLVYNIFQGDAR